MTHYDAIIIGAGQAGPSLAASLTSNGQKVAIAERHLFGGTCVNTGCIPTKTLVASAKVANMARRAKEYGIMLDSDITVDMKLVKARKDDIVAKSNQGVTGWLKGMNNLDVYEGHATFESANSVLVNGKTISADKLFINVGARARVPDMPGIGDIEYFTNTTIMDVDTLPEHLIIVGGSYIGLEFAQIYKRFGSKVTVIEMSDRVIAREDDDVSTSVQEILEHEGIQIECNAECISFEKQGDKVVASLSCSDETRKIVGSHVLLAVGRVPNTDDLGLEKAGLETDVRGLIPVNDQLQTSVSGIWALGECNGKGAFTHTTYNDYEIVADQLLGSKTRLVSDRIPCYGLYIDPPLGRVGMTEQQVKNSGKNALVGKMMMANVGRAKEKGETQGFMKVMVDADSKEILGANILGVGGDEIIHLFLDTMYAGQSYEVIKNAVHIHPTVAELVPTMLQNLTPLKQ
ncbi:MAG: FAD-containing oxidoreductase [Gammaproteobacteria bacterium]|nr:FAD-containing oxidoreductase [Gammaproteobacteria bacterium]